jgi:RNA polymerase sigma factor (sigma-70 family)
MSATAVLAPRAPRIIPFARMGDESLAHRAAAGNADAFTALYERYYGPLLGYCRSILLNAEDAHDATQNALENALRALPRREPDRPLKPWLYRIAHNEAINIVRRRQPIAAGVETDDLLTVPGPEFDAEQRSRLAQLVDDLRMLPERQRGALVMRELSGLSYDEIASALNVTPEGARRAVFDARTALHDAADGRNTECTSVRRCLSDGDRRRLRARGMRAHLRACNDCATFERAMGVRQTDLHMLGPWLGGGGAVLGLLGYGTGTAKASALAASGSAAAVGGTGLSWTGLPVVV